MGLDPTREALRLSWLSIVVGTAVGAASVLSGLEGGSLALLGSGATVLVDVSSSAVLVWRFRQSHDHPRAERLAHVAAASALVLLALVIAATSVHRLVAGVDADASASSAVVAAVALVLLPGLARAKYRAASRVGSGALRADAHITSVGAVTALLGLAGVVGQSLGAWWADPTAAVAVAVAAGATGALELASVHSGE